MIVPEFLTREDALTRLSKHGSSKLKLWLRSLFLFGGVLTALLLLPAGCKSPAQSGGGAASPATNGGSPYSLIPDQSRQTAPDFNLTDIDGNHLTLSQYRGKVVLLDFWAVDCGGCVIEIPWYVEFDKKYHDKGLQLIGLDMYGEAPAYIKPFMQKSQMHYPVAVGNDDIGSRFKADELPKTMLIDRQGRVAIAHTGIVDKAKFEQDIEELLQ